MNKFGRIIQWMVHMFNIPEKMWLWDYYRLTLIFLFHLYISFFITCFYWNQDISKRKILDRHVRLESIGWHLLKCNNSYRVVWPVTYLDEHSCHSTTTVMSSHRYSRKRMKDSTSIGHFSDLCLCRH
jgi:hypothetical protein